MKITRHLPLEAKFDIEGLTAQEFGYIVACLGVQNGAGWEFDLYDRLSDAAESANVPFNSADFTSVRRPK